MTKKHFRALATAMHELKGNKATEERPVCEYAQWQLTCIKIADVCASQNPRFDRDKFITACENGL